MSCSEEEYGQNYKPHLLEQYKLYVEMADRISARRQTANSFFLSVNTAIIALIGYVNFGSETTDFYWLVSLAGMILCYMWYRLIRSYKGLNSAKFEVIQEMEQELPFAPYDTEWDKAGRGKKPEVYLPCTHIEMVIPWVFFAVHVIIAYLGTVKMLGFIQESICQIFSSQGQL